MLRKIGIYMDFIKIEHTLFALPFAYAGALLASHGLIDVRLAFLILTAFTGLRTAAMTFNRIIDREIDAKNPRTSGRHIPAGVITLREAYAIAAISLLVYFISTALINKLTFILSPIPALTSYIYPYLKRYTCLCHYVLGLNLAFAPAGGWIAVTGTLNIFSTELVPLLLAIAVTFWVAGFDMIYGLQDVEFDRKEGLHSFGAHFGVRAAIWMARINHVLFLFFTAVALHVYHAEHMYLTIPLLAMLLIYEHHLVWSGYKKGEVDGEKIQIAFFHLNAMVSAVFLLSVLVEAL